MSETEVSVEGSEIALPDVPGIKTYASQIAAILAVTIPTVAHFLGYANIPTIDQSSLATWLTLVIGLGFVFHRKGLSTASKYILIQMVPILQQVVSVELDKRLSAGAVPLLAAPDAAPAPSPEEDMSRFVPVLEALGVKPTSTPTSQAFTINGVPYEPADLLKAVEGSRAGK